MDFIKSLRSGYGVNTTMNKTNVKTNRINSSKPGQETSKFNMITKPPVNTKATFKDRFINNNKCPTTKLKTNSERLKTERQESRRNQRSNMINNRRIINTSELNDNDLDSTNLQSIVIPSDLSPRKQKLMLWRAKKEAMKKVDKKPVFKVTHVNPNIFEKQKTLPKSYVRYIFF